MKIYLTITTLTKNQLLGLVILVISFWYNGIFLITFITKNALWAGLPLLGIFILSIPVAYFAISGVVALMKLRYEQTLATITFIVVLVSVLHALALLYVPTLYTLPAASPLPYIWLMWFSSTVLVTAIFK